MCLGIPSRIVEIHGESATIDVDGVQREANIQLLENLKVGDYVVVHAGFAITTIDPDAAQETLMLLQDLARGTKT